MQNDIGCECDVEFPGHTERRDDMDNGDAPDRVNVDNTEKAFKRACGADVSPDRAAAQPMLDEEIAATPRWCTRRQVYSTCLSVV